jgi:hypothetical protein
MFFTKSLLSTGSIHFFCFTFTSPKSIASARWGKMPFASRRLLDRNGNWFGEKLPGYPADPGRSQQIPQIPGILGQKAEQKQPKIWLCPSFGISWEFSWDLSNKHVGYI